jgi:predicted O-methyltransferase YrrM
LARDAEDATGARSAADLAIAAILAEERCHRLADPVAFVGFLRDAFEPTRYDVHPLGDDAAPAESPHELRFRTLLDRLDQGVPPLARHDATRIGLIADALVDRRDPFERPHWVADVGLHAMMASSFARKGRLLAAVVRFMRPGRVLELGTAYGLSALFLAQALRPVEGTLLTLERSHPQVDIARELLAREHPDAVEVREAIGKDAAGDLGGEEFGFLFHDAEHSERAYVEDFEAFLPHLAPGAVVLFDDIRWSDPHSAVPTTTYRGWRRVAEHARVRRAVELDGLYGLALLS